MWPTHRPSNCTDDERCVPTSDTIYVVGLPDFCKRLSNSTPKSSVNNRRFTHVAVRLAWTFRSKDEVHARRQDEIPGTGWIRPSLQSLNVGKANDSTPCGSVHYNQESTSGTKIPTWHDRNTSYSRP